MLKPKQRRMPLLSLAIQSRTPNRMERKTERSLATPPERRPPKSLPKDNRQNPLEKFVCKKPSYWSARYSQGTLAQPLTRIFPSGTLVPLLQFQPHQEEERQTRPNSSSWSFHPACYRCFLSALRPYQNAGHWNESRAPWIAASFLNLHSDRSQTRNASERSFGFRNLANSLIPDESAGSGCEVKTNCQRRILLEFSAIRQLPQIPHPRYV